MIKRLLAILFALIAATAFAATDVNKANQAELEAIKGIGPAIAGKILDERKKGNFKDWPDMVERVKGVGDGNAAKFSTAGLTVNGQGFAGAAAPAAKADAKPAKADKPAAKTDAPAAAAPAPAPAAKADKAAAKTEAASAPMSKADAKLAAKAKKDEEAAAKAKAAADDKAAKAKAKADAKATKADAAASAAKK